MSELAAGPELDAEIAQRVFGQEVRYTDYRCDRNTRGAVYSVAHGSSIIPQMPYTVVPGAPADATGRFLPEYSSDIAAAWLVVEAMRARGYVYEVGSATRGHAATFSITVCLTTGDLAGPHTSVASFAPEAICRAALKALAVREAMLAEGKLLEALVELHAEEIKSLI